MKLLDQRDVGHILEKYGHLHDAYFKSVEVFPFNVIVEKVRFKLEAVKSIDESGWPHEDLLTIELREVREFRIEFETNSCFGPVFEATFGWNDGYVYVDFYGSSRSTQHPPWKDSPCYAVARTLWWEAEDLPFIKDGS
ncbi:MAG: hypothetical protein M3R04_00980 [bacterium]|nr:hypothetical protein [bacterium]